MIMKKLLVTLIAFVFFIQINAQSSERRLGIEVNGGINEYQGDLGSALFFARGPGYQGIANCAYRPLQAGVGCQDIRTADR